MPHFSKLLIPALTLGISPVTVAQTSPLPGSPPVKEAETGNPVPRPKSKPIPVNRIVAKVNGEVITYNQLMIQVASQQSVLMARFPRRGPAYQAQLQKLKELRLNDLIDRAIIFSEFKDKINMITDQQIEDEVKRIVNAQFKGDEELFKKYLKATRVTRDQFKQQQKREILVQAVRAQHFGEVAIPRVPEMRKDYEEWKITNRDRTKDVATYRRIYLRKNRGGGPEAQLLEAERIAKKLKAGGDFAVMAETYSDDSRAAKGGLWEDVPRTDLNMEFGTILFETEGNQVLGPIEDRFGFNIIQVVERKLGPAPPYEKAREQIKMRVMAEKKKANFERWMKKMRARADIKKML